ncbi:MAG TPA: DUF971 domain-containing protein [Ignavibacteriaceae bacterium]|nr:DUF971 domain-containing protein [Ignavibacteriaceae bacterium]
MRPKQIKIELGNLVIKWDNSTESKISIKYLRDECPCANCKGETILLKTYRPPKVKISVPEAYQINEIKPVGTYAIQVSFKDGHNTGIYTWDYLLKLADDQDNDIEQNYNPLI